MRAFRRVTRIFILWLLVVSVFVPIFLLSHRLKHVTPDASKEFIEDLSVIKHRTESQTLSAIEEEEGEGLKEPLLMVYKDGNFSSQVSLLSSSDDNKFSSPDETNSSSVESINIQDGLNSMQTNGTILKGREDNPHTHQEGNMSTSGEKVRSKPCSSQHDLNVRPHVRRVLDEKIKQMKDQVIRAKAYLAFTPPNSNSHFVKELKLRIKELERAVGESTKDSDLSRSAMQRMRAMEASLLKASRMYPDCAAMAKKLRAMTFNVEEQLRSQKNQATFLVQLAGRTTPKGQHCLAMRLTAEYFSLQPEEREFPNQDKLQDQDLYHFAVFSDNVLACGVVVNSTIAAALDPKKLVFHIVTDSINFPAMQMWFLLNPPGLATIQVQSIDALEWLSSKYGVKLQKQDSLDPRYTSPLNHLRFYLPDVFPQLNKIVLLDHDVVVQRDLTGLWRVEMKGKVNGAVQTCKEGEPSFRRMDMFVNFTDPVVAQRFNPKTCTWAFGMNLFDLREWRRHDLTGVYHKYLQLGYKRPLWKAGSLPIGWITFYKHTVALDRRWHLLGLGYDSGVRLGDVEQAAVIHFDGIMKPWLDIGLDKYKRYWKKHINYEHPYLQQCNIHE